MRCLPPHLPSRPVARTIAVGAGKAAAAMARTVEDHWDGDLDGLVITPRGHGVSCSRIEVVEASHPIPDEVGSAAARRILAAVSDLGADDLVLCLLSGGGSALMAHPPAWLSLADKQRITGELLCSGASISEINCVRKHLSEIKGGRLGVACHPARLVALMISDVPGDDVSVIASGPTVADPTTCADAAAILERYGIALDPSMSRHMSEHESPKPGDPRLRRCESRLIARPADALAAAAAYARGKGVRVVSLGADLEGEARALGEAHAEAVGSIVDGGPDGPVVLLSGGETTVAVRGPGRGGRNAEYLLALARALDGRPGVHGIACDTDGIDGTEDNAGCTFGPDTLARAAGEGLVAGEHLDRNDAYSFFAALDGLVVTGPTRTNVNDFRAILISGLP